MTDFGFIGRWDGVTETFPGDRRKRGHQRKVSAPSRAARKEPVTCEQHPENEDIAPFEFQTGAVVKIFRLVESQTVDADISRWLSDGFRRWLNHGGDVPLTSCLGIPGKARLVLRQARDIWLREAGALFEGGPWQRAQWLRAELRRFAAGAWPRQRTRALPPDGASRLDVLLHFAFRVGAPMPNTTQAVWAILKQCEKPA